MAAEAVMSWALVWNRRAILAASYLWPLPGVNAQPCVCLCACLCACVCQYSQLEKTRGQECSSIGKLWSCSWHSALMVILERERDTERDRKDKQWRALKMMTGVLHFAVTWCECMEVIFLSFLSLPLRYKKRWLQTRWPRITLGCSVDVGNPSKWQNCLIISISLSFFLWALTHRSGPRGA